MRDADGLGHWHIEDKDAKVTYRPAERDFNRFMNASDLLEKFVEYVKTLSVTQKEFMGLPIELFINWLILHAAEADGEDPPPFVIVDKHPALLPPPKKITRCLNSGRFIPKIRADSGILFATKKDMKAYADKVSW